MNLINVHTHAVVKINLNILLPSMFMSFKCSLLYRFLAKILHAYIFSGFISATCPSHLILLYKIMKIVFCEEYNNDLLHYRMFRSIHLRLCWVWRFSQRPVLRHSWNSLVWCTAGDHRACVYVVIRPMTISWLHSNFVLQVLLTRWQPVERPRPNSQICHHIRTTCQYSETVHTSSP